LGIDVAAGNGTFIDNTFGLDKRNVSMSRSMSFNKSLNELFNEHGPSEERSLILTPLTSVSSSVAEQKEKGSVPPGEE